eukprot:scaffold672_cov126-Cylindrotheca_fusiformis.AAC.26
MGFFSSKKRTTFLSNENNYVAPTAPADIDPSPPRTIQNSVEPSTPGPPKLPRPITAGASPGDDEYSLMSANYDQDTVRTEETRDTTFTITRNGESLTWNGFANGHLMRWKFAAEEGLTIVRIPALLLAVACIITTVWPLVTMPAYWHVPNLIGSFHTCVLCMLILVLEGRVLMYNRSPMNARAWFRGVTIRYLNVTKLVWGRGLLYIFAGSMNLTIDFRYVIYTGLPLCVLGLIAIATGAHASYNLDKVKSSLTDESYLWGRFSFSDSDSDGRIDINSFAELMWDLGMEFDDVYTYKAFQQIDKDADGKISFDEFKTWWIVSQNDHHRLHNLRV